MKYYIDKVTMEYPLSINEVVTYLSKKGYALSKKTKDTALNALGYALVNEVDKPSYHEGKRIKEGPPFLAQTDGKWYQTWVYEDLPEEVVPVIDPSEVKMQKVMQLDSLLEQARSIGYPLKFGNDDNAVIEHVQLRTNDRMQLLLLKDFILKQAPEYINFIRTTENNNHQLTRDEIISIIEQAIAYDLKLYAYYRYTKDNLMGSDDPISFQIPEAITYEMLMAI